MTVALQGRRLLVVNDDCALCGELTHRLTAAGVDLVAVPNPASALPHVQGKRLDGIIAFFNRRRRVVPPLVSNVRGTKHNDRTPVLVIAEEIDADTVKRLAALGVAGIIVAPSGADEVLTQLEKTLPAPPGPQSYDVRLINCLLTGARDLLEFYLGAPPDVGTPSLKHGTRAAGFASGLIPFNADGQLGSLSATFERPFIEILAAKTFGEAQPDLDDEACADLAGEMCNQILGKAKVNCGALGIAMKAGLPELIVGPDHAIVHKVDNPVITIPITSGDTTCVIEFTMGPGVTVPASPGPASPGPASPGPAARS